MAKSKINPKNAKIILDYKKYLLYGQDDKVKSTTAESKLQAIYEYEILFHYEDFIKFDAEHTKKYQEYLAECHISPKSKLRKLMDVYKFFKYYLAHSKYATNKQLKELAGFKPSRELVRLSRNHNLQLIPTDEEIEKIIQYKPSTLEDWQIRAILIYILLTGSRINATVTMKKECILLKEKLALQDPKKGVLTKLDKYIITKAMDYDKRMFPIFEEWYNYISEVSKNNPKCLLFPKVIKDKIIIHQGYEATQINARIQKFCHRLGILKYHAHSFRHHAINKALSFAKNGTHIKAISQNVGHESVATILEHYANMKPEHYIRIISNLFTIDCRKDLKNVSSIDLINELKNRMLKETPFVTLEERRW